MPSTHTNLHYHWIFATKNRDPSHARTLKQALVNQAPVPDGFF